MVLAGLTRQLRLQYAMRKDVIILGGIGLFGVSADHLILQRSENKPNEVGDGTNKPRPNKNRNKNRRKPTNSDGGNKPNPPKTAE